jgi:hypothetical protein
MTKEKYSKRYETIEILGYVPLNDKYALEASLVKDTDKCRTFIRFYQVFWASDGWRHCQAIYVTPTGKSIPAAKWNVYIDEMATVDPLAFCHEMATVLARIPDMVESVRRGEEILPLPPPPQGNDEF